MNEDILLQIHSTSHVHQSQVLQYFEALKSSDDGWEQCATALISGQYSRDEQIRFFCYQVIEHFLTTRYSTIQDGAVRQNVKNFIIDVIRNTVLSEVAEKSYLRNKLSQIVSLVFVIDYPSVWSSFFIDLIQLSSMSVRGADLYLRIMKAIDVEVVDREVQHTPENQIRNTNIKDYIRENVITQIVQSFYNIITEYETVDPEVVCSCLEVIGLYVSWIDISLIANDKFAIVLLDFLKKPLLRESACDCVTEIVHKGMDPDAKIKLIETFTTVLQSHGVIHPEEDEEGDFVLKLARLVNEMGENLSAAWVKSVKSANGSTASAALRSIEDKFTLICRFLQDEDDDISLTVYPFANHYINIVKQLKPATSEQKNNITKLLSIVLKKLEYSSDYDFNDEGEDEGMFQDYRKNIKLLFNTVAKMDSELILVTVHDVLSSRLKKWREIDFREVEVALHLVYQLGEALPAAHNQHFKGDPSKASALQTMLKMIVESGVSQHTHQCVALQYFETMVRYEKFFQLEPGCVGEVLLSFLDERGLRNKSAQVRSRASYLFTRFIRSVRSQINSHTVTILSRLDGLLNLDTPNGEIQLLTNDEKMFLYEVASQLIVASDLNNPRKAELMTNLLLPVIDKFHIIYNKLETEPDENLQKSYAECLNCAMSFASRASKGFSGQNTMRSCECVPIFTSCLERFLSALNSPYQRTLLQQGVRQFFHRMVVCLEEDVLRFVPDMVMLLLETPDAKELYDFIPMLNQLTTKFKRQLEPFLCGAFMPLVCSIFNVLNSSTDVRDTVTLTDKKLLRRGYFSFISGIVNSELADVIKSQEAANLEQILMTIIQGASEIPDPPAQKSCFAILKKLIEIWGGSNGVTGFDEYTRKNILPACFITPTKDTFDWTDAQTVLLLSDISACLKAAFRQQQVEICHWLKTECFPNLQIDCNTANQFCDALSESDKKFREYFKVFYENARTSATR